MTKTDARAWLTLFSDLTDEQRHICEHGHKECSTVERGPCLDDVLQAAVVNVDTE